MHKSMNEVNDELVVNSLENNLAIIRFDLNRRVAYVNDIFAQTMGYKVDEMIGMHHKHFCFPEFSNSYSYEEFWNGLLSGKSFQDKILRKNAKGEELWLEATYMAVFDIKGQVVGISKVATDITKRQTKITSFGESLQGMSERLNERAEAGIGRSQELLASINQIADLSTQNTDTLTELQKKAESIQGITKTIQGFASQTNLLALNAAIEAARAGEHGRGFDVVAKEVRKLSKQIEQSIIEISDSIASITKEVNTIATGTMQAKEHAIRNQTQVHVTLDDFKIISADAASLDAETKEFKQVI
ncbi:methyl-accepting chemotaxis protein [Alkalicoccobacillus murimartini]|uniref:PAS domain S-box-containing protein n=1 Tax=Alkalicoccobacillus murimartini TaxID=171685 RepID=A0ABT9YH28_9BACI|nr:methyl-accepting chemotaxis protein [Alkalicoccobacillus murimartini]MDQ0207173.1 PAS domain S-box-containing protein [Alkalicoccobacillus murimartini]